MTLRYSVLWTNRFNYYALNLKKVILYSVLSLGAGVVFGQADAFGMMKLLFTLIIVGVVGILMLLLGGIGRNREAIKSAFGLLGIILITGLTSIKVSHLRMNHKEDDVNQIISELYTYKKSHSVFPANLDNEEVNYRPDSNGLEFKLSYIVDGWHGREYSSKSKVWREYD